MFRQRRYPLMTYTRQPKISAYFLEKLMIASAPWLNCNHLRITELLKEKGISKNRICKDLDIPRGNFNRYCRDEFQRIDSNLLLKLCRYFDCKLSDLMEIRID